MYSDFFNGLLIFDFQIGHYHSNYIHYFCTSIDSPQIVINSECIVLFLQLYFQKN